MRINKRVLKEGGFFVVLMGSIHYMYYKMQQNPALVPADQRTELYFMKWLKDTFPSLQGKIGVDDSARVERDAEFWKARNAASQKHSEK